MNIPRSHGQLSGLLLSCVAALAGCGGGSDPTDDAAAHSTNASSSAVQQTMVAGSDEGDGLLEAAALTEPSHQVWQAAAETESAASGVDQGAIARDAALAVRRKPAGGVPPASAPAAAPAPVNGGLSTSVRIAAAKATAESSANTCGTVRPFYWEIGDAAGRQTAGSLAGAAGTSAVTATKPITLASASKWLYSSYVVQRRNGLLNDQDLSFLRMESGYTELSKCLPGQTVDACLAYASNGLYNASTAGAFDYDGGHMEKHASLNGLGAADSAGLARAITGQLGSDVQLSYSQPLLAGGGVASPDAYALVLRKILRGDLRMRDALGSRPVCTNRSTCPPGQALYAPLPPTESWHYSIGHWVEDDPKVGDGAFSSPGAFGFYPWIDAGKQYYGLVARVAPDGAMTSVQCGRLIRKAWLTGVVQ